MKNLSIVGYENYAACTDGQIINLRTGNFVKPMLSPQGYMHVSLSQNGRKKRFPVHRLVAFAFLDNPEEKPNVNHIDGDKTNNRLSNLEWATQSENCLHAIRTGLRKKFKNEYREHSDETVHSICKMIVQNFRTRDICEALDVPPHLVCNIRKGYQYKDITCQYDFSEILPVRKRICYAKIVQVCELLAQGYRGLIINQMTGVSGPTISRIKNRRDYAFISQNYEF